MPGKAGDGFSAYQLRPDHRRRRLRRGAAAQDGRGPDSETPLFEKGQEVFGLPQARAALREKNTVIVVEGYMDVVALAQHGIGKKQ